MTEAQYLLLSEAARQRDGYVYPLFKRASTARAAVRKGWLAYQGAGGYRLTDDGRAALDARNEEINDRLCAEDERRAEGR